MRMVGQELRVYLVADTRVAEEDHHEGVGLEITQCCGPVHPAPFVGVLHPDRRQHQAWQ
jgi:hypothetical protein